MKLKHHFNYAAERFSADRKGLCAGSQFCLLLALYMLHENTNEITAIKFLLKISIMCDSFCPLELQVHQHPLYFSPNATLSPETRRNDIIPPLLPSSGKLCHYNSTKTSLVTDWFSDNSRAKFFPNSV